MKRSILKFSIAYFLIVLFYGCDDVSVMEPDFSVKLADGQVVEQIGDTLICKKSANLKFVFEGNPDMLVFFSGKQGSEYRYKDRTEITGIPTLSFLTTLTFGTQFTGLKVYLSSTFPGITRVETTDRVNIANMEFWQEITNQCNLPTTKTSPTNSKASPPIDLTDFRGKPLYIAFRVVHPNGGESTWRIDNLNLTNNAEGVITEIGSFKTIGFTAFDMLATTDPYLSNGNTTDKTNRRWNLTTASANYITGGGTNGSTINNDDWAISGNINLSRTNPDLGTAIKGFDNAPLEEFEYDYNKTGVYNVTFVGVNSFNTERKEISKELIIKIID